MIRIAAALLAFAALPTVAFSQTCYPPQQILTDQLCSVRGMRVYVVSPCSMAVLLYGGQTAAELALCSISINPTPLPLPPPFPAGCVLGHDLGVLVVLDRNGGGNPWMTWPTFPVPQGTTVYMTALLISPIQGWYEATNRVRMIW